MHGAEGGAEEAAPAARTADITGKHASAVVSALATSTAAGPAILVGRGEYRGYASGVDDDEGNSYEAGRIALEELLQVAVCAHKAEHACGLAIGAAAGAAAVSAPSSALCSCTSMPRDSS